MINKVSVIGAGGWGTALAILLAEKQLPVCLWAHDPEHAQELVISRENGTYLPGLKLPPNITATSTLADTLDADVILMVTPSKAIREVAQSLAKHNPAANTVFVNCTKGIEHKTGNLMSQVLEECFPKNRIAVLSGPNLAMEIARHIPAACVIGSKHEDILKELQNLFTLPTFRAYTSEDVAGIQLGGALKNVFAIAAGVSDGFRMGDNAKASLMTRSLAELSRLGVALGGKRETFQGLSGIGDLMVTCFSKHSRNRSFGERIGQGESTDAIQTSMKMVAEGFPTTRSAYECARKLGAETPIIDQVYAVLYEGKSPREAMGELLGRQPREEKDDRPS
ncbi:MAG: NAD(P)H-dependent glycerol-3-phosphate dehydrogenase [Chthoniobacterales bacterium]